MKNKSLIFSPLFTIFVLLSSVGWGVEPSVSSPPVTSTEISELTGTTEAPQMLLPSEGDPHSSKVSGETTPSYRKYSSVHVDGPYIAMTFDDGPSPTLTPRLLDILKEKGVKATFFVIGQNVVHSPEIVARAAAEGHEIGNHSWSHPSLTKISEQRVQEEVQKTSDAISEATGKKPTLLRPPYGAINLRTGKMIEEKDGLTIILWSVDPLDWKSPGANVVAQRLIAGAKPGAITLSHDIKPGTIQAIPEVIDALKAKGYKFVTVSELIALESKAPISADKGTKTE
jgi:peptidoglycan-N-acetylglucosamine deacetylase